MQYKTNKKRNVKLKNNLKLFSIFISMLFSISVSQISLAYCCNPYPGMWGSVEYLYWWTRKTNINVPLATRNDNPNALGFIGEPGTRIIFGEGADRNFFKYHGMGAARMTLGTWFNSPCFQGLGIEISGFGFGAFDDQFIASSKVDPIPVVNIPFFDVQTASEDVLVFHLPNSVEINDVIRPWGVSVNSLYKLPTNFPLTLLTGFRFLYVADHLKVHDTIYDSPAVPALSLIKIDDSFVTKNNFYGFQIGLRTNLVYNSFFFDFAASLAIGANYQRYSIHGETIIYDPLKNNNDIDDDNIILLQKTGIFAQNSNIGTSKHTQFAFVPEFQAKVGYCYNRNVKPFLTYNFLYLSRFLQPRIDRNINTSQNVLLGGTGILTGPALPSRKSHRTNIWMQGFSIGIEVSC